MNELQNEQMSKTTQLVTELKARLYDAASQLEQQTSMIGLIAEKVGFKGQSFDELLESIEGKKDNEES